MAEAEIVDGGPDADLIERPGSGSYIGDQTQESDAVRLRAGAAAIGTESDARRARWLAAADRVSGTVLSRADGRELDGMRGSVVTIFVPDQEWASGHPCLRPGGIYFCNQWPCRDRVTSPADPKEASDG